MSEFMHDKGSEQKSDPFYKKPTEIDENQILKSLIATIYQDVVAHFKEHVDNLRREDIDNFSQKVLQLIYEQLVEVIRNPDQQIQGRPEEVINNLKQQILQRVQTEIIEGIDIFDHVVLKRELEKHKLDFDKPELRDSKTLEIRLDRRIIGKRKIFLFWKPFSMEPHDLDNEKSFSKNEIDLEFLTKKLNEGVRKLNSYLNLAMQDIENSTNYYLKAAKLACDMLETVLYNEPFRASVRRLARFQNEYEDELIKTILKDLDDFFQKEFELLHYHQMPNADLILERGRENLSNIIEGKGSRPSQAIYMALLLRCKRQRAN